VAVGSLLSMAADPFHLLDAQWRGVSPKLATLRRIVSLAVLGVLGAVAVVLAWWLLAPWVGLVVLAVVLVLAVWQWILIGRAVAAWGYTERAEDLLVKRGILWRQLVVVPYGRMQFVDVQSGPLERAFGLASVQLHTAAATTDAHIPGLPPEEAERLRDRLASLGESQSAGL
jgi:membrane protein YdbS with pleckstrin-like domain